MSRGRREGRRRRGLAEAGLVLASLAVAVLAAEFVVFRFVLLPSDVPENAFENGVFKYAPGQTGIFRVGDEIAAPFAINAQGWNAGRPRYDAGAPPAGTERIAIIGDSYVEAFQVPHDASLAERLESLMGPDAEVYRFGISAAPLSQYLYMLEREAVRFRPQRVVVVLVHNDFRESFRAPPGRTADSFMRLELRDGRVAAEVPPKPYERGWLDALRLTATARYLHYRRGVSPATLERGLLALADKVTGDPGPPAGRAAEAAPAPAADPRYEANIDPGPVQDDWPRIEAATDYLFGRLRDAAAAQGAELLVVMDAVRARIYAGSSGAAADKGAARLNRLAARLAEEHGITFLDLTRWFAADWRANGRRFEFARDGHWNRRGHEVAARAIHAALTGGPDRDPR